MKNYDEDSDKGYILEVDVEYPERLRNLNNGLLFIPERMKIKKCHKLLCDLYNKSNYIGHIKTLKKALNHR